MNYDVTHSLLYFWAAKAIKINHHAAPQGTCSDPALVVFGALIRMLRIWTQLDTVLPEQPGLCTKEGPCRTMSDDGIIYLNETGLYRW